MSSRSCGLSLMTCPHEWYHPLSWAWDPLKSPPRDWTSKGPRSNLSGWSRWWG